MAATAGALSERTIRVYCVTHKVGFDAQANKPLLCARGDHAVAMQFPDQSTWEYCCDCQHCWLVDTAKQEAGSKECPACEREIVRRYLCGDCNVISLESNEPARRKVHSLTAGVPTPNCPGCLRKPQATAFDHECGDYGARFVTNAEKCRFCDQVLEAPTEFPCTVAECLASLHSTPTELTFDSQKNELKPAAGGEYVLLPSAPGISLSLVIPKIKKLNSKRDYYHTYYELFNCENPISGEVVVVRPATAKPKDGVWIVNETGTIEINAPKSAKAPSGPVVVCGNCGTRGKPNEQFCGRCGVALSVNATGPQPSAIPLPPPPVFPPAAQTAYPPAGVGIDNSFNAFPNSAPAYDFGSPPLPLASTATSSRMVKVVLSCVAALFLLAIIIAFAGNSISGNSVEKQLDQAINRGNLFPPAAENAHDLYNQLKAGNPSEDTLRKYRARLIPLLTKDAITLIEKLMQPGYDEAATSDWQNAGRNMIWAAELMPADKGISAKAAYCQGRVAYLEKRNQDAIESWKRAAQLDPLWALPLNSAGLVQASDKNYAAARLLYFEAVRRNPQWANPYNNVGTSYYMEKDYADAKDYYRKAVEIAPNWARPHAWLGDIAMIEKDFSTAVTEYQVVLSPQAIGTGNMNLDKIRQRLAEAQRLSGAPAN